MNLDGICLNCFSVRGEYEVCPYCGYMAGTVPREAYLLSPGTVLIDRYIIGTILGIGGFGVTYKVWDTKLSTVMAIKEFYPGGLVNRIPGESNVMLFSGEKQQSFTTQKERFLDEARNMAKFTGDQHIVNVFDFFEANNTAYIVMEHLVGLTLKAYMAENGGRLPADEAVSITLDLLKAVKNIHDKGIIHRDISPDNIFIMEDGRVKLLDFGAARFAEKESSELTQAIVIKMGYAPPEQYRSNMKQGVWTDIYAIGATLYKMLTGVTPEESVDRMEKDTLKRPSQCGVMIQNVGGTKDSLDKTIMKAMALKPELRFKSVDQMAAALENRTSVDFPEEELKKRKRMRAVMVILAVAAMLGMGSYIGYTGANSSVETLASIEITGGEITVNISADDVNGSAYYQLAESFSAQYPEYRVRIQESDTYNGATLYQDSGQNMKGADLTLLLDSLNPKEYWFLENYDQIYEDKDRIPIGFDFLTVYADQIALGDAGITIPAKIKSSDELSELYQSAGESIWIGVGSELRSVQAMWPGYYEVIPCLQSGQELGALQAEWSVSASASETEQQIAMLFLHFLLSDYAQNYLFVQNDSYLPLNKNALEQYLKINADFSFLSGDIGKMKIYSEKDSDEVVNYVK